MAKDNTIHTRIALLFEILGVSKNQLSKALKRDFRLIKKVIDGESLPSYPILENFINVFGVRPEWLMKGKEPIFEQNNEMSRKYTNKLDEPIFEPVSGIDRILYQVEIISFLKEWIEVMERHLIVTTKEDQIKLLKAKTKHALHPKLEIGIKADISINKIGKYTINNTLKIR